RWYVHRRTKVVIKKVVTPALIPILTQVLWTVLPCMRTDDTRRAWICIGSNHKRVNIKWRSCHVGRRVWRRRVRTEKNGGIKRKSPIRPGKKPLRKSNVPQGIPNALLPKSPSRL